MSRRRIDEKASLDTSNEVVGGVAVLTTEVTHTMRRFAVVDHQALVRDRFVARLRKESDIEVIATGGTAEMAIELCQRDRPDVLLLDPFLPDVAVPELIGLLRMISPVTRVIIITDSPRHSSVTAVLAAGAAGILVKHPGHSADETQSAVSHRTGREASLGFSAVTPREREVTKLVAAGHTNTEIGSRLGLSNNTVKSYLRNAMQKLQARNRAQLVTNARKCGVL